MKIALIFGAKSSDVKLKLQSIKDNLVIDCFDSVPMMIDMSMKRGTLYDRIVVLSSLVNATIVNDLWQYWSMTSKSTSIVLLGKAGAEEALGRAFMEKFRVPNVSAMLVNATTVQIVSEAVLLQNRDINEKYGIKDILSVNTGGGVVVNLAGKDKEPEPEVEETPIQVQEEPANTENKDIKEKRTIMGALFGGKKKEKTPKPEKVQKQNKRQKLGNNQPNVSMQDPNQTNMMQNNMYPNQQMGQVSQNPYNMPMQNMGMQNNYNPQMQGMAQNSNINYNGQSLTSNPGVQNNFNGNIPSPENHYQQGYNSETNQFNNQQNFNHNQQGFVQETNQFNNPQNFNPNQQDFNLDTSQYNNSGFNNYADSFQSSQQAQYQEHMQEPMQTSYAENIQSPPSDSNDYSFNGSTNPYSVQDEFERNLRGTDSNDTSDYVDSNSNGYIDSFNQAYSGQGSNFTESEPQFDIPEPQYTAQEPQYTEPEPQYAEPESQYIIPDSQYTESEPQYTAQEPQYTEPEPQYVAPEPQPVPQQKIEHSQFHQAWGTESFAERNNMSPSPISSRLKNDFDADEVTEDLGDSFTLGASDSFTKKGIVASAQEVEADLGGMNLSSIEESYRAKTEQPKVITNTVVREVVRNVGGGDNSASVKNILAGKNPSLILVTGDRGSGVTTTAMSIARFFAEKTDVLYVDYDINFHGLLSLIDYEEFRNNEPIKMHGIKLCRSSTAFNSCVCSLDDNLDMLTGDYSSDATEQNLEVVSEVVAELIPNYGVIVVDCPVRYLHLTTDLILSGSSVVCTEASKRGFMNILCALETSDLPIKYKKMIANKGIMLLTKLNPNLDVKKLVRYVGGIYEPDGVNWLSMRNAAFNGKMDMKLMSAIISK